MSELYEAGYAPADREQELPAPVTPPDKGGERPRRGGGNWLGVTALICALLALAMSGAALYLALREEPEQEEPPPVAVQEPPAPITFQYGNMTLEALEGVPVNGYDADNFYFNETGRAFYSQGEVQAKTGVDVSYYQAEIDWEAVAADGVDFAMIRLGYRGYTQGSLQMDQYFRQNIQGALDAGLEVGVYFFSQALTPQEAAEEADYVAQALEGYQLTYPVAFDWEFITPGSGARTDNMTGEAMTQCAISFCETIRGYGYAPAIYFNQNMGYLDYDLSQLEGIALWLAEYGGAPDFYYHFDMWQYTNTGEVDGITGNVDLNLDLRPLN